MNETTRKAAWESYRPTFTALDREPWADAPEWTAIPAAPSAMNLKRTLLVVAAVLFAAVLALAWVAGKALAAYERSSDDG